MNKFTEYYSENQELVLQINKTIDHLSSLDDQNKLSYYPLGFFRIFIKFQNCIYDQFEKYCLGEKSSKDFLPERKHVFYDSIELRTFLGSKNRDYIDYDDRIMNLSEYIFVSNPFRNLSFLSPLSYQQLIDVRNYIAHESDKATSKLLDMTHNISVEEYFAKKKDGRTNFEKIITCLKQFSDYIIDGEEN